MKEQKKKMLAFALMLTVPVSMSGCGQSATVYEDCDDISEELGYCEDDDDGTTIIKKGSKKSSVKSASASKGFGSGGTSGFSSGG